jgi:alpha-tubulin suppressor-like RCC1 family protein
MVVCWGDNSYGQASPPPGAFASVSAGSYFACGVRMNGTITCWGYDTYGQATPPAP